MTSEAVRNIATAKRETKDHNLVGEQIRLTAAKGVLY